MVLNDAYNASPDAVAAALRALAALPASGRHVAVLGAMRELGPQAHKEHERMGRLAGELGADVVLALGDDARAVAEGARASGVAVVVVCADAEDAVGWLERELAPGDAVLVKASRAVGLERVAHALGVPDAREPDAGDGDEDDEVDG